MDASDGYRQLEKKFDWWLIAAAFFVSFLGTFTSTQLMIQAQLSSNFFTVFTWIAIISLTFGFCASWSLHFVGMLSCKLDLPIKLDVGLTLLSAVLAVSFTFASLGAELLWKRYNSNKRQYAGSRRPPLRVTGSADLEDADSSRALLADGSINGVDGDGPDGEGDDSIEIGRLDALPEQAGVFPTVGPPGMSVPGRGSLDFRRRDSDPSSSGPRASGSQSDLRIGSGQLDLKSMADHGTAPTLNAFVATYYGILSGMSCKAVGMGLIWSLSLTCMHYGGLLAMNIPEGRLTFHPVLVTLSAIISWVVCIAGYIYMVNIEPHLSQQVLFSAIAASGIAAMHFTGLRATTFWSRVPPAQVGGYPLQLPIAVCTVAILTCTLANGLLAHNATVSRNKLAEIVLTRRKLWRALAQKENAELAAAARSNFIASASHEIRTPLHHLQGYSDLLSKANLSDDARQLVLSIQNATKTLSLITNNVLDWSKLESDRDASCRLAPSDMRSVFESILVLLPHQDEQNGVEILAVVAPTVPESLLLDEAYFQRILMNLLSNSLKFTSSGYVMLSLEMDDGDLIAKVADSGAGIPSSFIPRLFEPFSQGKTRGTQRGTGLGLSIVKQLLSKMQGNISVESRHVDDGFRPSETGTTFTIRIPVQVTPTSPPPTRQTAKRSTVALLSPPPRLLDGLETAWQLFGYDVLVVNHFSELADCEAKYAWADFRYLAENADCLRHFLSQAHLTTFVPFEHQESLQHLPGVLSAPHFVPLPKPLVWHTFYKRIAIAAHAAAAMKATSPSTENGPQTEPRNGVETQLSREGSPTSGTVNILLVEDNAKLCIKMLSSLGYSVLLANDGDQAIEQTIKHDKVIDLILMDQSMPVKDGVCATREIRVLEHSGKLSKRHPIIALTAVVSTESRAQFKSAGADDFLAKPLSFAKLEQTLATFLRIE
ncbi:hypothetical protein N658DRAFT_157103 [Parathielavia hyrcaniae]|uniref:Histidine kinase n=1 Tax=Parathielavia hyrcaniae TaxID=113614 RepID=A0AAN6PX95_9PEZI|nr:hypothetical protein N658DRAFT_157103 [Parathielavia hyrcaniae]